MMAQTDIIRGEIEALEQRKHDLGRQIEIATNTLNILNGLIRSKTKQLRKIEIRMKTKEEGM